MEMPKNLTVRNVENTEWFKQFNPYQKDEILLGMKHYVDVSIYAYPEFNAGQMKQIRLGLEDSLDVLQYAKPEFDWKEMEQIKLKLLKEAILKNTF